MKGFICMFMKCTKDEVGERLDDERLLLLHDMGAPIKDIVDKRSKEGQFLLLEFGLGVVIIEYVQDGEMLRHYKTVFSNCTISEIEIDRKLKTKNGYIYHKRDIL